MKLDLTPEGANQIRIFAAAMPQAINNINEDTVKLTSVYTSVAEDLGIHENNFAEMLMHIKKATELSADAIDALPKKLEEVATAIDEYCNTLPTA